MDAKQLRDGDFFDTTGSLFKALQQSFDALKLNVASNKRAILDIFIQGP